MSKLLSDTFFDGATVLGSVDCTYHLCMSMGGIKGGKALFNSAENRYYTMAKVVFMTLLQHVISLYY